MTITINKENFGTYDFGLSPLKKAKDGDTQFYWVLMYPKKGDVMYAATSESFTKLLGKDADDDKLVEVIAAHQNEFEVANIHDDALDDDARFEDGTPIYCIRKRAHRKSVNW